MKGQVLVVELTLIAGRSWRQHGRLFAFALILNLIRGTTGLGQVIDDRDLPDQEPTERYTQLFSTVTWKGSQSRESPIAFLYEPRPLEPGKKYPLVVWLHGGGLPEYEYTEHYGPLLWTPRLVIQDLDKLESYPFYLLVPKCPSTTVGWRGAAVSEAPNSEILTVVADLIEETIAAHSIDPDRVSLVGISNGASASWELGMQRPELFSAIAPIAGGCRDLARIGQLPKTPVWMFANDQHERDRRSAESSIAALRAAGGQGAVTLFHRDGHDAWTGAFAGEPQLLEWLLSKSRGNAAWSYPPGYSRTQWFGVLQRAAITITVLLGICGALTFRNKFTRNPVMPPDEAITAPTAVEAPPTVVSTARRPLVSLKVVVGAAALYGLGCLVYQAISWWSAASITVVK